MANVISACSNSSYLCSLGKYLSVPTWIEMKWFLNVPIAHSAGLRRWLYGAANWYFNSSSLICSINFFDTSLSNRTKSAMNPALEEFVSFTVASDHFIGFPWFHRDRLYVFGIEVVQDENAGMFVRGCDRVPSHAIKMIIFVMSFVISSMPTMDTLTQCIFRRVLFVGRIPWRTNFDVLTSWIPIRESIFERVPPWGTAMLYKIPIQFRRSTYSTGSILRIRVGTRSGPVWPESCRRLQLNCVRIILPVCDVPISPLKLGALELFGSVRYEI